MHSTWNSYTAFCSLNASRNVLEDTRLLVPLVLRLSPVSADGESQKRATNPLHMGDQPWRRAVGVREACAGLVSLCQRCRYHLCLEGLKPVLRYLLCPTASNAEGHILWAIFALFFRASVLNCNYSARDGFKHVPYVAKTFMDLHSDHSG